MRVSIIEKLRQHLNSLRCSGELMPGEKLPSMPRLAQDLNSCYASISRAIKILEREGLVDVYHGKGVYLRGRAPLRVELFIDGARFLEPFCRELRKIAEQKQLFINLVLRDVRDENYRKPVLDEENKFALVAMDSWNLTGIGNAIDFSQFGDYNEVCTEFKNFELSQDNLRIPFFSFYYQPAINTHLMKRIGFPVEPDFSCLDWWQDYVAHCKNSNFQPISIQWRKCELWNFSPMLPWIIPLMIRSRHSRENLFRPPFFNTSIGKRILLTMNDFNMGGASNDELFLHGKSPITFSVGSWITKQLDGAVFDLSSQHLKIISNRPDGRRFCSRRLTNLRSFCYPGVTGDELSRVWELIKLIVSRRFQLLLTADTGWVSVRRDISPQEHPWVTRENYLEFFPDSDDPPYSFHELSRELIASLSTLFECYHFLHGDLDDITALMDEKLSDIK